MPNSFAITAPSNTILLNAKGQGDTTFTVTNTSGRTLRGRARLVPKSPESATWLKLADAPERDFANGATQQFVVQAAVPPGAPPGSYAFSLDMIGLDNPDENYTAGPSTTFEVKVTAVKKRPFPWWIVIVAAIVLIAAIAVGVILSSRQAASPPTVGQSPDAAAIVATQEAGGTATAAVVATSMARLAAVDQTATAQAASGTATVEAASAEATKAVVATNAAAQQQQATATAEFIATALAQLGSIQQTATAQASNQLPTVPIKGTNGVATITNVKINGGANVAEVARGANFDLTMDYTIVDIGCPGCIDQLQIGFDKATPTGCIYNGVPGTVGASGSSKITLTAPAQPGTYYVGFDRSQDFSCPTKGWWNGAPSGDRLIAAIVVK